MSDWIVSKTHIRTLVQAAIDFKLYWRRPGEPHAQQMIQGMADRVGAMLWGENHRSVNYRYDESEPTPEYAHEWVEVPSLPALYNAVRCYDYQTCECPDYDRTEAHAFVVAMELAILNRLVHGTPELCREYDAAPWGINDPVTA